MNDELYLTHYGILGMKWGRHKKIKPKTEYQIKLATMQKERQYAKEDLKKQSILEKLSKKEKSKSQLKWEQKYKEKGMTDSDAAVAAYQRIKTTKILTAVGAVAVASLTAYSAYKIRDYRVDKIIKSGTNLQNISANGTKGIRDSFYASHGRLDNLKYKGLYGKALSTKSLLSDNPTDTGVYSKKISALRNIKQASPRNAHKILAEMAAKDANFLKELKTELSDEGKLGSSYYFKMKSAKKSLEKGKVNKSAYEVFNALLVDHSPGMQKVADNYYKTMAKKGYNAILDVNDKKYSGFNTRNPIIMFGSKGLVKVTDVKKLVDEDMEKAWVLSIASTVGSSSIKTGSKVASAILAGKGAKTYLESKRKNNLVENYKKEHPNTNKNYTEILRMLEMDEVRR